ncbi:hypothetical protein [Dasania marina]|uniref:hypothetical protein n=1 Tax=Dasania marina TaxID=471499 RepID=UPI000363FCD3|nr:hypothetical protein [Dasania marina]
MTRKALRQQIQQLNHRLNERQKKRLRTKQQLTALVKNTHPFLLVAVGLFAGVASGLMGWRKVYAVSRVGFNVYPLLKNSVGGMVGMSND